VLTREAAGTTGVDEPVQGVKEHRSSEILPPGGELIEALWI
jgi:hypothetical protein